MTDAVFTTEPATGLKFYELSHEWGHGIPVKPGHKDMTMFRPVTIAENGVMSQRIKTTMHNSTHVNAPLHLISGAQGIGQISVDRFFGNGVVVPVKKQRWEHVSVADLEAAKADIRQGDIIILNLGWHDKYSDSSEYFGQAPGLSLEAAEWLIAKKPKMVGVDTPQIDHPMATLFGCHRKGPHIRRLPQYYEDETGKDPREEFKVFAPAHKAILGAGIPTIENVGGAIEALNGQRATFHAQPWRWNEGDACTVRLVAIQDPTQSYKI